MSERKAQEMIDRRVGEAVTIFHGLVSRAKLGERISWSDAMARLRLKLDDIAERSMKLRRPIAARKRGAQP